MSDHVFLVRNFLGCFFQELSHQDLNYDMLKYSCELILNQ